MKALPIRSGADRRIALVRRLEHQPSDLRARSWSAAAGEGVPNERLQFAECVQSSSVEQLSEHLAGGFREAGVSRRLRLHSTENYSAPLLATGWHHQITMVDASDTAGSRIDAFVVVGRDNEDCLL